MFSKPPHSESKRSGAVQSGANVYVFQAFHMLVKERTGIIQLNI